MRVTKSLFERVLELASTVVAADGGVASALACGAEPEAVIGDFDSNSDETARSLRRTGFFTCGAGSRRR